MKKMASFLAVVAVFGVILSGCYSITNDHTEYLFPQKVELNVLKGKSILFMGDSVCQGRKDEISDSGKTLAYAGRISELNNMRYDNVAVAGYSISSIRPDRMIEFEFNQVKDNTYDYVILQGGYNDAISEAPIGEIGDGFELERFDKSTLAGGLEALFYYAREYFPNAKLGFIISGKTPKYEKSNRLYLYCDSMKEICQKWDVSYLDLYNSEEYDTAMDITTKKYFPDNLHPNAAGYDIMSEIIEKWIRDLQ